MQYFLPMPAELALPAHLEQLALDGKMVRRDDDGVAVFASLR